MIGTTPEHQHQKFTLVQQEKPFNEEFECSLISYLGSSTDTFGRIILTNYRCAFQTAKQSSHQEPGLIFDLPIGYISKCESHTEVINKTMLIYVNLTTKLGLCARLKSNVAEFSRLSEYLNSMTSKDFTFAENLGSEKSTADSSSLLWSSIRSTWSDPQQWHQKYGRDTDALAQIYDNPGYQNLPLYPLRFKVPRNFIGRKLTIDRIPVLSFNCELENHAASLWRTGPGKPDSKEDEWVSKSVKLPDHFVVDIRNRSSGFSRSAASLQVQLDNPFALRESFSKLLIASYYGTQPQSQYKWLSNAQNSNWMEQTETILKNAYIVYNKLISGINVTLLSEWDIRGAQIAAVVQMIMVPEYRTIRGFADLLQKQFLAYGSYVNPDSKKEKNEDKGIGLIQFLECVFQLSNVYPLSFEFNEDFLTFLALNVYSKKYGNFLYFTRNHLHLTNSVMGSSSNYIITTSSAEEKEKRSNIDSIQCKCLNIWSEFDDPVRASKYLNPFYVKHSSSHSYQLKCRPTQKNLRLWSSLFNRDLMMFCSRVQGNQVVNQYRQLSLKHLAMKQETEKLKNLINKQHKEIASKREKLKEIRSSLLD